MFTRQFRDDASADDDLLVEKHLDHQTDMSWVKLLSSRQYSNSFTKRFVILAVTLVTLALLFTTSIRDQLPQASTFTHVLSTPPASHARDWSSFDTLFTFGDSYTSYREVDREDDPPYKCKTMRMSDGLFSNKPNWITFLTEIYNTSPTTAINFAEGGSTLDRSLVPPFALGSTLQEETAKFIKSYGGKSPARAWQPAKTLFTMWFGVNDLTMVHLGSPIGKKMDRPPLSELFESYKTSLTTMYDAGARNFLLLTAPPFDRSFDTDAEPWHIKRQLATIADITAFNARLYDLVHDFRRAHSDAETSVFDTHRLFSRILEDPSHFEATVGLTHPEGICHEASRDQQPGPQDEVYDRSICSDGELIQSYAWTPLHTTFSVMNATARQITEDCFKAGGPRGYCS